MTAPSMASPPTARRHSASIRELVDHAVRELTATLIETIVVDTQVDPDDYQLIVASPNPYDAVVRLVHFQATASRTTKSLCGKERPDLTIEAMILGSVDDLPWTTDVIDGARGRLDYWSNK